MKSIPILFRMLLLISICTASVSGQTTPTKLSAERSPGSPGTVFRDCADCPEMVVVPAGNFTMGSSAEEKSWAASHGGNIYAVADEAPQHR